MAFKKAEIANIYFIHLAIWLFVKHYQKIAVFFKNIMLWGNKYK